MQHVDGIHLRESQVGENDGVSSNHIALRLPQLFDREDGGKNIIHKCAQVKTILILEEIIEYYRRKAETFLLGIGVEEKIAQRQVKRMIQEWVN